MLRDTLGAPRDPRGHRSSGLGWLHFLWDSNRPETSFDTRLGQIKGRSPQDPV